MKKVWFILACLGLCLVMCTSVTAKDITFEWDDYGDESGITGYKIYKRLKAQEFDFEYPIATIPAGTFTATVSADGPYIFCVTAYADTALCESENYPVCYSDPSNEVTNGQFNQVIGAGMVFE